MTKKTRVLVIGARGAFGNAVLTALSRRSEFETFAMVRPFGAAPKNFAGRVIEGDGGKREDLRAACRTMDVIVYGLHLPYERWKSEMVPKAQVMAEVAAEVGARLVYPGNVYGLGPNFETPLREDCSKQAPTQKGEIRNAVENTFEQATKRGMRLLIIRSGDFFGPGAKKTWLAHLTARAHRGVLLNPEPTAVPHAFAYLPDLAETIADLLAHESRMKNSETYHFRGHQVTPTELLSAIRVQASRPLEIKRLPWLLLTVMGWFSKSMRETVKMRYLWQKPVLLDDSKLQRFLGKVSHTPLDLAVYRSVEQKLFSQEPSSEEGRLQKSHLSKNVISKNVIEPTQARRSCPD